MFYLSWLSYTALAQGDTRLFSSFTAGTTRPWPSAHTCMSAVRPQSPQPPALPCTQPPVLAELASLPCLSVWGLFLEGAAAPESGGRRAGCPGQRAQPRAASLPPYSKRSPAAHRWPRPPAPPPTALTLGLGEQTRLSHHWPRTEHSLFNQHLPLNPPLCAAPAAGSGQLGDSFVVGPAAGATLCQLPRSVPKIRASFDVLASLPLSWAGINPSRILLFLPILFPSLFVLPAVLPASPCRVMGCAPGVSLPTGGFLPIATQRLDLGEFCQ